MTRVVVTGAAGFIGSNLIKGLNARGVHDIIAVDDMTQGDKFRNIADLQIADYVDADVFYDLFAGGSYGQIEAVFHEGACSDTMETNGKYMMDNNYTTSCRLFFACQKRGSRLLYASSAATYGGSQGFREEPAFERPLNVYGYSKQLFDQWVRRRLQSQRLGDRDGDGVPRLPRARDVHVGAHRRRRLVPDPARAPAGDGVAQRLELRLRDGCPIHRDGEAVARPPGAAHRQRECLRRRECLHCDGRRVAVRERRLHRQRRLP